MQKVTVRTKGRKIGARDELCNKYKHSKTLFVKGRRDDFKASAQKGKEQDGTDASGICMIHDTGVFEGI